MSAQSYDELVDNFEFLEDWEERYRYVIELGKALPPFDETKRTDETLVPGCVSRVWLDQRLSGDESDPIIEFEGDSDAHIVRGLIAVLRTLLSGHKASDIIAMDVPEQLERISLAAHISPQRSNGLTSMIHRIKGYSEAALRD